MKRSTDRILTTHTGSLPRSPELAEAAVKEVVGRENVIAGVDCGFGTFAGTETIHRDIAWLKLRALVESANWRRSGCLANRGSNARRTTQS